MSKIRKIRVLYHFMQDIKIMKFDVAQNII